MSLLLFTFLFTNVIFSQGITDPPALDDNLIESKQYKRLFDYSNNRETVGLNGDWLRKQTWEQVMANHKRIEMEPWQNHGPDTISGRIISIDFHPSDPNTFLVGSASGGLWRT